MARSCACGHLPTARHIAGARPAVVQLWLREAGAGSRRVGVSGPGRCPVCGSGGVAAYPPLRFGGWLLGGRRSAAGCGRGSLAVGPRHHASDLGNRFLPVDRTLRRISYPPYCEDRRNLSTKTSSGNTFLGQCFSFLSVWYKLGYLPHLFSPRSFNKHILYEKRRLAIDLD